MHADSSSHLFATSEFLDLYIICHKTLNLSVTSSCWTLAMMLEVIHLIHLLNLLDLVPSWLAAGAAGSTAGTAELAEGSAGTGGGTDDTGIDAVLGHHYGIGHLFSFQLTRP